MRRLAAGLAAVAALAGCGGSGGDGLDVGLRLVAPDNNIRLEGAECAGARPYQHVHAGTAYALEDVDGEVLADGELPAGVAENADPTIDWGVERIPTDLRLVAGPGGRARARCLPAPARRGAADRVRRGAPLRHRAPSAPRPLACRLRADRRGGSGETSGQGEERRGQRLPQAYAQEKLGKLDKHLNDAARLELELAVEKNPSIAESQIAEGTIWTKGPVLRARESSPDMRASIDMLVEKLERQARRYRDKRRRGQRPGARRPRRPR